ncbi:RING finger protein 32 [Borealophlyctis nickersoniae]|nr:RING finger protein 32 [Borealophlyctis nickersoniae]
MKTKRQKQLEKWAREHRAVAVAVASAAVAAEKDSGVGAGAGGKRLEPLKRSNTDPSHAGWRDERAEKVLDPAPRPLTLAQKLGFVPCPPPRLSPGQWEDVKRVSEKRDDFTHPCAICQEAFTMEDQVLLSCSHVFHRTCLESYERYIQKKSCPLCRQANYEKRLSFEGRRKYQNLAAVRIQKTWRMWRVRKVYLQMRRETAPKEPILLAKWHMDKLSQYSESLATQITSDRQLRDLFRELDAQVAQSRNIIDATTAKFATLDQPQTPSTNWDQVYSKVCERAPIADDVCPICICPLDSSSHASGGGSSAKKKKKLTLLSCAHVFHDTCLSRFEMYDVNLYHHVCPVCRAGYERIEVHV